MDTSLYKQLGVLRGLEYHYYHSPPVCGKPTLLFVHGFPSSSQDWHHQIQYFQPRGYGILAPDILGAGRTSRPLDPKAFRMNSLATDIIEILDAEHMGKVIGVGHDWGCNILSRLSMLYPDRFYGFAWLGLSFMEPITTQFDLDAIMVVMRQLLGYEGYSYWKFFERKDAADIIEKNIDSFLQLLYPKDPECWRIYMALPGKTSEWMESNMQPGWAEYMTKEEFDIIRRNILEGGIRSGLNFYISQLQNNDLEDNLRIPQTDWKIQRPSFFAVALRDAICTPLRGKTSMKQFGTDVTTVEFDTGHWVHIEASERVNAEFEAWINKRLPLLSHMST